MSDSETITIRVSKEDKEIISHYAKVYGLSTSEFIKKLTIEKVEDEIDIQIHQKAMEAYNKDEMVYSLDETERMLNL